MIETPELILSQLWPPNSPDLNSVDNSAWDISQEKMYKTCITDLELSTTPLTNGFCNDIMIQLGHLHSQLLFQFVQISDAYSVFFVENLFRKLYTEFHENRLRFIEDITKNILVSFFLTHCTVYKLMATSKTDLNCNKFYK